MMGMVGEGGGQGKTRVRVRKESDRPRGVLIDQKGIEIEFGIRTRDVIRWTMSGAAGFPRPLKVIGRVYWFERATIEKYFGVKGQPSASGGA